MWRKETNAVEQKIGIWQGRKYCFQTSCANRVNFKRRCSFGRISALVSYCGIIMQALEALALLALYSVACRAIRICRA